MSFGSNGYLSGLMDYGSPDVPQMSSAPGMTGLTFTGDNGQVANLGAGAGMMNYGMSPVPAEIATGFPGGAGPGWWDQLTKGDPAKFLLGGKNIDGSSQMGALPVGLGALQGAASLYMGMQQYGLAKKQLSESKRQFDMQYGANKTLTNARLEDRQAARVASNPGAYQSVDAYMAKNGVK